MSIWDDKKGRKHVGVMVDGKRVHRKLPEGATTSDAKLVEAEIRASVARAPKRSVNIPSDPSMTVVLALYVEHAKTLRSSVTSIHHAKRLGPWAEKYKASQAQEFADHVIKDMRNAYAHATINRSLACAKKGLMIAWRQRLTHENYGLRIESMKVNNKREVFLTVDQVRNISQHCSDQARAAIWAALLTGARRNEICQIQKEHIGTDTIMIPSGNTKTFKMRVIPIIPALRPWLQYFPLTISMYGVQSSWRRARVKAQMEHVNFHDLRHSCASIMLGLGVDLYTISKILGHSSVQTTQRYAHLQVDAQRAALSKLSELVQN
ncbi:MAG: site-specific integrase [Pseudomonadota bacterium]